MTINMKESELEDSVNAALDPDGGEWEYAEPLGDEEFPFQLDAEVDTFQLDA